jgi:ParB-like chromosome segregation protein Spo0J
MIANINKLVEVPALKNFYSEQLDSSLLNSIKESGVKTPIVISKNFQIIDGYRRVQVCKFLLFQ